MGKNRGFLLKHRIQTVFRWPPMTSYRLLELDSPKHVSNFCKWTRILRSKVKSICCLGSKNMVSTRPNYLDCKYMQTGDEEVRVPKGYMPVYVGQRDGGDFERVLVPVIYFNDPLFGQLLREAEEEFGFDHPGAITIPCPISEFEHVQTRIKQRNCARNILSRK